MVAILAIRIFTIGEWYQNLSFGHRWREILEPRDGAVLYNYFQLFIQLAAAAVPRHFGKKFQVFQATSGESTAEIF